LEILLLEMVKMSEKEKNKLELLYYIPTDMLIELAEKNGIPKYGKKEELIKRLAESEKISYEIIEEIYEEFEDAGNITIHLFQFISNNLVRLKQEKNLIALLKKVNLLDTFNTKKEIKVTSKPEIVQIKYVDNNEKIKVRLEFRGKEIIKRDAETKKVIHFHPLIYTLVVIHLKDGLVEVRTRNRDFAKITCERISEIFSDGKYTEIKFNENEIETIINWARTFRNATIKPLSGGISSLRMTASRNSDLRNEGLYAKREKIIGECIRTGVYLQFDFERDGKIRNIGFQINTNQGKLYFKTKSSEKEIDYVLQKIKEIKGL